MTTAIASDPYAALNATASASSTSGTTSSTSAAGMADTFLKLLVTQMQNQDPMNPMDNAQITSQMAQINTVSGLQTLNTSVQSLNTQFVQMQALQGASLVGHDITLQGNRVDVSNGVGSGGFDLAAVDVLDPAGHVVDTVAMGAQSAGTHAFTWDASKVAAGVNYTFRVNASSGAKAVTSTSLMRDQVVSVSTSGGGLVLQTQHSGDVAYGNVMAFD